jgi:hypothetical protein
VSSAIEDRANIEPNDPVTAERRIAWKLTPSVYHETAGRSAVDLNLRAGASTGDVRPCIHVINNFRRQRDTRARFRCKSHFHGRLGHNI